MSEFTQHGVLGHESLRDPSKVADIEVPDDHPINMLVADYGEKIGRVTAYDVDENVISQRTFHLAQDPRYGIDVEDADALWHEAVDLLRELVDG